MPADPTYCGHCGAGMPPNASVCPRCNRPVEEKKRARAKTATGIGEEDRGTPLKGALLSEMAPPPWPKSQPLTVLQGADLPPEVAPPPEMGEQVEKAAAAPAEKSAAAGAASAAPVQPGDPGGGANDASARPAERARGVEPRRAPSTGAPSPKAATAPPAADGKAASSPGKKSSRFAKTSLGMPSLHKLRERSAIPPDEPILPPEIKVLRTPIEPIGPAGAEQEAVEAGAGATAKAARDEPAAVEQPAPPRSAEPMPWESDDDGGASVSEGSDADATRYTDEDAPVKFPDAYIEAMKYLLDNVVAGREREQRMEELDASRAEIEEKKRSAMTTLGSAAWAAGVEREDLLSPMGQIAKSEERQDDLASRRQAVEDEKIVREAEFHQRDEDTTKAVATAREALAVVQEELADLRAEIKQASKDLADAERQIDAEGRRVVNAERKLMQNPPDAQELHAQVAEARKKAKEAEQRRGEASTRKASMTGPEAEKSRQAAALDAEVRTQSTELAQIAAAARTYAADVTGRLQEFSRRIAAEEVRRQDAALVAGETLVANPHDSETLKGAYDDVAVLQAELDSIDGEAAELEGADAEVDGTLMMRGLAGAAMAGGAGFFAITVLILIIRLIVG